MATVNLGKVGMTLKGVYEADTQYEKLDVVYYEDSTYCAKSSTKGNLPTDEQYWQLLIAPNPLNIWKPNTKEDEGYVEKGEGNEDKVWATDSEGNPAWREYSSNFQYAIDLTSLPAEKPEGAQHLLKPIAKFTNNSETSQAEIVFEGMESNSYSLVSPETFYFRINPKQTSGYAANYAWFDAPYGFAGLPSNIALIASNAPTEYGGTTETTLCVSVPATVQSINMNARIFGLRYSGDVSIEWYDIAADNWTNDSSFPQYTELKAFERLSLNRVGKTMDGVVPHTDSSLQNNIFSTDSEGNPKWQTPSALDLPTNTEVDTKIAEAITAANVPEFVERETVPNVEEAEKNKFYLVKNEDTGHYDIYALLGDKVEQIDDTTVDLSNYVTKEDGKGLSTEDFTAALEEKLDGIEDNAQVNTIESISVNGTNVEPNEAKNVDVKAYNEDNKPEVGGRNLLPGTKEMTAYVGSGSIDGTYNGFNVVTANMVDETAVDHKDIGIVRPVSQIDPDTDYTLSFWVRGSGTIFSYLYPYAVVKGYNSEGATSTSSDGRIEHGLKNNWEHYWVTWHTKDIIDSETNALAARVNKGSQAWICGLKFERGEIATDWTPAPEDLAPIDEQKILAQIANRTYQGTDLTVKFKSEIDGSFNGNPWAWIQSRINNANWDGIHICDYIPFTTTNSVTMQAQIAGMDTYYQYSDQPIPHHIDFIAREIWPTLHTFNPVNYNNGTATQNYPWLASDMYLWLNSKAGSVPNAAAVNPETTEVDYTTGGVYYFLPEELKAVIIEKRFLLETRYNASSLLTTSPGWGWQNAGKLWLPTEMEVYGTNVWGGAGYPTGGGIQYPIFANSMNRLKYLSGSRYNWWLSTPNSGNSTYWGHVSSSGLANNATATNTWIGAPVCFRIASTVKTADMPEHEPEIIGDESPENEPTDDPLTE